MKALYFVTILLGSLGFAATACRAQTVVDPHAAYEKACYSCHTEHAADLARQRLAIKAEKLIVARSGKELTAILKSHHGVKLKTDELAAVSQLFRNGLAWGGVFQHRCAGCHEKAVSLARTTLKLDGDRAVVIKSGQDIGELLKSHGDATASEIETLAAMLKYQLATTPKP